MTSGTGCVLPPSSGATGTRKSEAEFSAEDAESFVLPRSPFKNKAEAAAGQTQFLFVATEKRRLSRLQVDTKTGGDVGEAADKWTEEAEERIGRGEASTTAAAAALAVAAPISELNNKTTSFLFNWPMKNRFNGHVLSTRNRRVHSAVCIGGTIRATLKSSNSLLDQRATISIPLSK